MSGGERASIDGRGQRWWRVLFAMEDGRDYGAYVKGRDLDSALIAAKPIRPDGEYLVGGLPVELGELLPPARDRNTLLPVGKTYGR